MAILFKVVKRLNGAFLRFGARGQERGWVGIEGGLREARGWGEGGRGGRLRWAVGAGRGARAEEQESRVRVMVRV